MKVNTLYKNNEMDNITIESYLNKCGIKDFDRYSKAMTVENTSNYDNIDKWCEALRGWFESSKRMYLLEDS